MSGMAILKRTSKRSQDIAEKTEPAPNRRTPEIAFCRRVAMTLLNADSRDYRR